MYVSTGMVRYANGVTGTKKAAWSGFLAKELTLVFEHGRDRLFVTDATNGLSQHVR